MAADHEFEYQRLRVESKTARALWVRGADSPSPVYQINTSQYRASVQLNASFIFLSPVVIFLRKFFLSSYCFHTGFNSDINVTAQGHLIECPTPDCETRVSVCLIVSTSAQGCTWSLPCYVLPDTISYSCTCSGPVRNMIVTVRSLGVTRYPHFLMPRSLGACGPPVRPPHSDFIAHSCRQTLLHSFIHSFMHACMRSVEGGSGAICPACSVVTCTIEPGTHDSTQVLKHVRYEWQNYSFNTPRVCNRCPASHPVPTSCFYSTWSTSIWMG